MVFNETNGTKVVEKFIGNAKKILEIAGLFQSLFKCITTSHQNRKDSREVSAKSKDSTFSILPLTCPSINPLICL
jgi:hypothetical protein